jgi:hypothetical protein
MRLMRCTLVTHTHWDREWYRTHQHFRARLVDAVDRLLDLCAADPHYHFLLDGQAIVLEDYLEIRPGRRGELEALCREGRIGIGPWYVQPDSLLPSGESHVRNLLEGRRVADAIGRASRVAYTPDSFGHPAQFPQLFAGFGLQAFVYWRGHGDELERLPTEYWWEAPDGTAILACHLARGYFNAATGVASAPAAAARRIAATLREQIGRVASGQLLLMNGIDHALPEPRTEELAEAIAKETGFDVERGLIEDFLATLPAPDAAARHRGELVGGRQANLLPGVWSTRTWIKLRNRACEAALEGWAEPWCALGERLGTPDERPALRTAWRALLPNHAHDSICGCSHDAVHEQMRGRFDVAEELASATTQRVLERLAGLGPGRVTPWTVEPELAVFNPSPHPRTDVVRFAVDPHPWMAPADEGDPVGGVHPLALRSLDPPGFEADGVPVRVIPSSEGRMTLLPDRPAIDLEFVVEDVPAFGWKRVPLRVTDPVPESCDEGREISAGDVSVRANDDGTFDAVLGGRSFVGLGGLEDRGDRGDSYDADLLAPDAVGESARSIRRFRHASGLARLEIRRVLEVGAGLAADRERREGSARVDVRLELRVAPGVPRIDAELRIGNEARDHRLRLLLPTGQPVQVFEAATTFDVARRAPGALPSEGWIHPAPDTFPSQGFVHAGGLSVVAPGLAEAEVGGDGTIALTLLRCVGDLSRHDLRSRPGPAGPGNATPGAQCLGPLSLRFWLFAGLDAAAARDAELGLRAVPAGDAPLLAEGTSLVGLSPAGLLLSALKPSEDGDAWVARILNPHDDAREARLELGLPFAGVRSVRLDEQPDDASLVRDGNAIVLTVPAHGLRTLRLS